MFETICFQNLTIQVFQKNFHLKIKALLHMCGLELQSSLLQAYYH